MWVMSHYPTLFEASNWWKASNCGTSTHADDVLVRMLAYTPMPACALDIEVGGGYYLMALETWLSQDGE